MDSPDPGQELELVERAAPSSPRRPSLSLPCLGRGRKGNFPQGSPRGHRTPHDLDSSTLQLLLSRGGWLVFRSLGFCSTIRVSLPQIIAAQEEMLKKERELEEARKKLAQIRQQQYKFLPSELREEEG